MKQLMRLSLALKICRINVFICDLVNPVHEYGNLILKAFRERLIYVHLNFYYIFEDFKFL